MAEPKPRNRLVANVPQSREERDEARRPMWGQWIAGALQARSDLHDRAVETMLTLIPDKGEDNAS